MSRRHGKRSEEERTRKVEANKGNDGGVRNKTETKVEGDRRQVGLCLGLLGVFADVIHFTEGEHCKSIVTLGSYVS